jgi:transcriptional regulator with XRE-family HTH domain
MGFGTYLRHAREKRGLTLGDVAARTKIKRQLLADVEDDDVTRWPKYLIYRHGYLRSIANAVGLDGNEVIHQFDDAFPDHSPVAFDNVPAPERPAPAPPAPPFLERGAMTLAVALGIAVGVLIAVSGNRSAVVASLAEADPVVVQTGHDITLEPVEPLVAALAPSSGIDDSAMVEKPSVQKPAVEKPARSVVEGEVRVVSNPPDAVVTVNGIGHGRTPARIRYLPLGSYRIRVIQDGYQARESSVTLTPDEPVGTVRVALRAQAAERAAAERD